jgi:hypothetical protein
MDGGKPPGEAGDRVLFGLTDVMAERREKRKRWVQRGQYAVEVEVEVVFPADDPDEPCLEPATVRWLDEVANRAEAGDIEYLHKVGRVFQSLAR